MAVIKWRDAYTDGRTTLEHVKGELDTVAICETHGRVVHRSKNYVIVEQHKVSKCSMNDYFIIPKHLILKAK